MVQNSVIYSLGLETFIDASGDFEGARLPQCLGGRYDLAGSVIAHTQYYVWSEERPPDWNEGMLFPGVQEAVWTYDKKAKKYYFHCFCHLQPDLNNLKNPEVRTDIRRIIGYRIKLGMAGFRVDAFLFI